MTLELNFFEQYNLDYEKAFDALDELLERKGPTGWIDLPNEKQDTEKIKDLAKRVRDDADVFILCGIGGSYLGARAIIEAIQNIYHNDIEIIYTGNSLNPNEIYEILEYIEGKSAYMNVVSKSGSTMETLIAFSIFKEYFDENYTNPNERIIVTTGNDEGDLAKLAKKEGYDRLDVPDDIGGRYSIMTPVGLFPLAVAGLDIDKFLQGGKDGFDQYLNKSEDNLALQYSALRSLMYESAKEIEILVTYDAKLDYLGEWWRQLYGESQCKGEKGLYPSTLIFTCDLHSVGQLIQDGKRNIFETVLTVRNSKHDINIPQLGQDGKKYDMSLGQINDIAIKAAIEAHLEGGVPNILISIDKIDERSLAELMYFFMVSCAVNSYELCVNPFDQPGVEKYKKNIKKRL